MSIDNYLFEKFIKDEITIPILRLYRWSLPTLSIGQNQDASTVIKNISFNYPLEIVKRITGGQAVLHDTSENELTYSIVLNTNPGFCNIKKVYYVIGNVFLYFLEKIGLIGMFGYSDKDYLKDVTCFNTKTQADIVVDNVKVVASAQVKRKNFILQHGTIRLNKIRELSNKNINYDVASILLKASFEEKYNITFLNYSLHSVNYEKINTCN